MRQFIPFEDDWDALSKLRLEDLVPYRVGMLNDLRATAATVFPTSKQTPGCEQVITESSSAKPHSLLHGVSAFNEACESVAVSHSD